MRNAHPRPSDESISAFWDWFVANRARLESASEGSTVLEELDARVQELAPIAWEVGPGREAEHALTLSPGGEVELLDVTRACIGGAPTIPGWEFLAAKPPKDWSARFSFTASSGAEVPVDSNKWRYLLARFPNGTFDIDVIVPELASLTESDQIMAIEIALDGVLGETQRMRLIEGIHVVRGFDKDRSGTEFTRIAEHLSSMIGR